MVDNAQGTTSSTVVIKSHHFRWGVFILILVIGGLAVAAFYAGGGNLKVVNGQALLTTPDLATLGSRLKIVGPDGVTKSVIVQDDALDNGTVLLTRDGFGSDGKLQRTDSKVDRYDPLDRLAGLIAQNNQSLAISIEKTNRSLENLGSKVNGVSEQVTNLGGDVSALGARVTALESKPVVAPQVIPPAASPSPNPAPSPQAQAQEPTVTGSDVASGDTDFVIPKGFHVAGMGDSQNIAKAQACRPPHKLVVDMTTSKPAGYNDPKTGEPVMRHQNKCV